jgi:hypothetical protein
LFAALSLSVMLAMVLPVVMDVSGSLRRPYRIGAAAEGRASVDFVAPTTTITGYALVGVDRWIRPRREANATNEPADFDANINAVTTGGARTARRCSE